MANWWESSPLVKDTAGEPSAWWKTSPEVTPPAAPTTTARGVARNIAAGGVEGGTSLLNMVTDPFSSVIAPTIARVGGTLYDAGAHLFGYPPISEDLRNELYGINRAPEEQPFASRVVNAIDQAIPGAKVSDVQATTMPEQLARKVAGAATAGGVGGVGPALVAAGSALTGDVASRSVPDWLAPGAELLGDVAGAKVTGRVVTPVRTVTTPERQRLVGELDAEGVPLTAGERTGSKPLLKTEQMLGQTPGSAGGIAEDVATQQRALNSAVAQRAGLNSDTLTHDVLNNHMDALGQEIGTLAANNNMQLPTPFVQQLGQVRQGLRYMKTDAAQEIGARLDQLRDMITVDAAGNPVLAGPHYQNLMSDLREAITASEGTARGSMIQLRDMLRQQMEASMNPADAARWRELNRHYANGMVIRDAMGAAGAGTAEGNISPLQLRGAINRSLGSDAYSRGYGDLNDLARAGQSVLRKPPDSGSPQGIAINALLKGVPLATGAAGGYLGGLEGLASGLAVPAAVGMVMRGRVPFTNYSPGQSYLTNQLARGLDFKTAGGLPALLARIEAANNETQRNALMSR